MIRRATKIAIEVVAGVLALVLLAAGVGAWRLSQGPVGLGFLTPTLLKALNDPETAHRVEFDSTVLTWAGWEHALELHVRDVRVLGGDGALWARIPELDVNLSLAALARGIVAPTALDAVGASLHVRRLADGRIALDMGTGAEPGGEGMERLLAGLFAAPDGGRPLGYLSSLRIRDASATFEDMRSNRRWEAVVSQAHATRDTRGIRFAAAVEVLSGREVGALALDGLFESASGGLAVTVGFKGLVPAALAAIAPEFEPARIVEAPLDGRVSFSRAADGRVPEVGVSLTAGAGRLILPALYKDGLAIAGGALEATFTEDFAKAKVGRLVLDLGGPKIELSADADGMLGAGGFHARGAIKDVPLEKLGTWWPLGASPGARVWMLANMREGRVRETTFDASGRIGMAVKDGATLDTVKGQIAFDGASVVYLKKALPVRGLSGTAQFDEKGLDITTKGAGVKSVQVTEARIRISGLDTPNHVADMDIKVAGSLRDAVEILDGDPLNYTRRVGLAPADVDGAMTAKLTVHLPLLDKLRIDDVAIAADADLVRMAWRKAFLGRDAKDGTLNVKVDNRAMTVQGQVTVAETPFQIRWSENFQRTAEQGRLEMSGTLNDAGRVALGFDMGSAVKGPVGVRATMVTPAPGTNRLTADLTLTAADLSVEEIRWRKPAGAEARARVTAEFGQGPPAAVFFDGQGGGVAARGQARLGPGGKGVRELVLDAFSYRRNDFRGTFAFRSDGATVAQIVGNAVDAEPFLGPEPKSAEKDKKAKPPEVRAETKRTTSREHAPLELRIDTKRVWIAESRGLDQVKATLVREKAGWRTLDVEARLGKEAKAFKLRYGSMGNVYRDMALTAEDAGETLKAFGIVETATGGKIEASGTEQSAAAPLVGELKIKELRIKDAPVLARIFSAASLTGFIQSLSGQGLLFDRVTVPFSMADGLAEIKGGAARSADLGFTFDGKLDFDAGAIDMKGLVIPAYTLNSIIANIPIIGHVLAGGPSGGVFAATFSLRGSLDEPQVGVNPLAAFTPGVLRYIFSVFDGGGTSGESVPLQGRPGEGE